MNPKTDKRNQIIASTMDLFSRTHNINKVSLEAIAEAAGVSPTTIYNLFGTREDLIFEVVKTISLKNLEKNRGVINSQIPFAQKLAAIINGKRDLLEKFDAELIEKIMNQDPKTRPFIDELYEKEIKPLWMQVINEGKSQGFVDEQTDIQILLVYLDVIKAGLTARQDLLKGLMKNPVMITELSRLMFYGFLKKELNVFKEG
jgi:AcrR family transcriptional regulator